MIFPGFPPQKKDENQRDQDEFRPDTHINIREKEKFNLISASDTKKNRDLSDEEDERFNKIILERPVVNNKKKQKLKKRFLDNNTTDKSNANQINDKINSNNDLEFTKNKSSVDNRKQEEHKIERNIILKKVPILQVQENKESILKKDLLNLKPEGINLYINKLNKYFNFIDEIERTNEPNLNMSSKNIKNKIDINLKKEDLFDPLNLISKKSNTNLKNKANYDNSITLNKPKKFNLFDDEDDKPKNDKAEELFKLPAKRNTKILSFLDENEADDLLTGLKKNKTIVAREEKVFYF